MIVILNIEIKIIQTIIFEVENLMRLFSISPNKTLCNWELSTRFILVWRSFDPKIEIRIKILLIAQPYNEVHCVCPRPAVWPAVVGPRQGRAGLGGERPRGLVHLWGRRGQQVPQPPWPRPHLPSSPGNPGNGQDTKAAMVQGMFCVLGITLCKLHATCTVWTKI